MLPPVNEPLEGVLKVSWCDSVEHQVGCRDVNECFRSLHQVLVVFTEPPVATEPGETTLHDPGKPADLEMHVAHVL